MHRECFALFPDEIFADLFDDAGRQSVPPIFVAVVMALQRIEGLSYRAAVDRFSFDARWKYGAGGLDFDDPGSCTRCWRTPARRSNRSKRQGRPSSAMAQHAHTTPPAQAATPKQTQRALARSPAQVGRLTPGT